LLLILALGVGLVIHAGVVAMGVEAEEWPKYRAWYPALLAVLAVAAVLAPVYRRRKPAPQPA